MHGKQRKEEKKVQQSVYCTIVAQTSTEGL